MGVRSPRDEVCNEHVGKFKVRLIVADSADKPLIIICFQCLRPPLGAIGTTLGLPKKRASSLIAGGGRNSAYAHRRDGGSPHGDPRKAE